MTLREALARAQETHTAIGHFNVADISMLWAVAQVAKEKNVPVLVGVSEGERDFWGLTRIKSLVNSFRQDGVDIFLNADHTHSIERVKEAMEAGFDEILFDAGQDDLAQNIAQTRHVVEIIRQHNYHHGTDILVEGELGYIGSGSVILERLPQGADIGADAITKTEDAKRFIEETGVDLIAPAIGNVHGMFAHGKNPDINLERIREILEVGRRPMVLHGGSGIVPSQISEAVHAGVSVVHISTELRVAWRKGLEMALLSKPKEIAPYKILPDVVRSVARVVEEKLDLLMVKKPEAAL